MPYPTLGDDFTAMFNLMATGPEFGSVFSYKGGPTFNVICLLPIQDQMHVDLAQGRPTSLYRINVLRSDVAKQSSVPKAGEVFVEASGVKFDIAEVIPPDPADQLQTYLCRTTGKVSV